MSEAASKRKKVIGLIGGIGSGKSAVARDLAELGCAVIDADVLAREALHRPEVMGELAKWWGPSVIKDDGTVDRAAVAKIVFRDPEQLRRLEALTHPIVHAERARLRQRYQRDPMVKAIVEDCPLILEKGLQEGVDVLVFVEASTETRLQRVASRGWTRDDLENRERQQLPLDIKADRADYVVSNNAGEVDRKLHVSRVLSQILESQT